MTSTQKKIIEALLKGATIYNGFGSGIRLRDEAFNPLIKIHMRSWGWMQREGLVRKAKGLWVIDKRQVRTMHGNSFIKKKYKQQKYLNDVRG